ncbi:DUF5689 domain-containing protein [Pedobacter heparinus]|uniref:DUF5689 domain-containing protein n=1 Tax=Pedobacter heparinus (strain ATCC 13125 / DSM 2366 / CIP 104194 / JCM 7457 / NBRC 12017 / NCIMB 9290 / NRRL B-14731 / HIM 762-3) TaxID=485917 RepID=C6Y2H9_PEDHD|nr:DUF5689 domain-containing protein [Pedobacter heparinus]ACU05189.1 hypothetical protein Phep_2991 [Pedobacter heparinus DSM 2366]
MKRTFTLSVFLLIIVSFWSCKDKVNIPENVLSQPQTIAGLRKVILKENMVFGTTSLKGIVISDAQQKNISNGEIIVQEEGKDAAVILQMESGADQYPLGAEIQIDLSGTSPVIIKGELVITKLKSTQVKLTGKTVTLTPKVTNLPTLLINARYWGPVLVKLEKVELSGGNAGLLSGEFTLEDGVGTVYSNIFPAAAFSANQAPDFVQAYTGILRIQDEKFFINPRNLDDIQVGLKELLEDFEAASSSVYDLKTLTFKTGAWIVDGGITANTSADLKTGLQSIRLQGTVDNNTRKGILAMTFDLKAVKSLKISHGIYPAAAETGNVNPTTLNVEISRDGGNTYTLLEQIEVDIKSAVLKTNTIPVNAGFGENVRFRIVNSSLPFTNKNKPRINIDDILFLF